MIDAIGIESTVVRRDRWRAGIFRAEVSFWVKEPHFLYEIPPRHADCLSGILTPFHIENHYFKDGAYHWCVMTHVDYRQYDKADAGAKAFAAMLSTRTEADWLKALRGHLENDFKPAEVLYIPAHLVRLLFERVDYLEHRVEQARLRGTRS